MPKWLMISLIVIAIIIVLIIVSSLIANLMFDRQVKKEVRTLFSSHTEHNPEVITKEALAGLPLPVRNWLENAQIIGKEKITSVRLKQKGQMRTTEDGPWMAAQAEQYFTVAEPGFVWKAKVKPAPLLTMSGLDKYYEGKGKMDIKILSLFPVVDAKGPELDQGTMMRFLAEMPWFPTAALSDFIRWDPIDSTSARATMSYKGVTASAVFTFNDKGDLLSIIGKRYRETNGIYELVDWGGVNKEYKTFNGIRIPSKSDIIWRLETGDFKWFECEITEIEYNKPELYE